MAIPLRPFGCTGLETSRLGFGCMSITPGFYASDLTEEQAIEVVQHAYDHGVRLFNTSDLYGPYTNEKLVGKALKGKPGVFISTKWGPMFEDGKIVMDGSPENARRCCNGSLERLQVESVELFTMRGPTDPKHPIEETMKACKELLDEGKIKGIGLSEVSPEEIRRGAAVAPIAAVEFEWSLFTRDAERDIVPVCRELGIALLVYSPLGRGLLTGKIKSREELNPKDWRSFAQPRFAEGNIDKNLQLVANLEKVAARKGSTPGQLALAWLLHQGDDVFLIPGTKRIAFLDENIGAASISLTPEELAEIEEAVPESEVAGDRYPDMRHTYHGSGKAH